MFESLIVKYCISFPLSLVLSLVQVESSGVPTKISKDIDSKGIVHYNYGLMQLNTKTAKSFCGITDYKKLLIPQFNIKCGCSYLEMQYKRYENPYKALLAYNKGSVPKSEERTFMNTKYIKKILSKQKELNF